MYSKHQKHNMFRQIMWDYQIKPEEVLAVFEGMGDRAGHYSKDALFVKLLESYSWFTILQIFSPEQVLSLLTDNVINKLRTPSLKKQYEFIRKRLQEIIPLSG